MAYEAWTSDEGETSGPIALHVWESKSSHLSANMHSHIQLTICLPCESARSNHQHWDNAKQSNHSNALTQRKGDVDRREIYESFREWSHLAV